MPLYTGFIQLGAGLSVGLAGLAAGFAIGIVGDAGVRGTAQQPRLFVGMVSRLDPFYPAACLDNRSETTRRFMLILPFGIDFDPYLR